MTHAAFDKALQRATSEKGTILLAWSPDPDEAMVKRILESSRLAAGRRPILMPFDHARAGAVRQAFIGAVCSGSSVLATGLHTLDDEALEAALMGLASISQWNEGALGVGLSRGPIERGLHRHKTIAVRLDSGMPRVRLF